jgi:hypothetical protein
MKKEKDVTETIMREEKKGSFFRDFEKLSKVKRVFYQVT